jgi:hypothetical protein
MKCKLCDKPSRLEIHLECKDIYIQKLRQETRDNLLRLKEENPVEFERQKEEYLKNRL